MNLDSRSEFPRGRISFSMFLWILAIATCLSWLFLSYLSVGASGPASPTYQAGCTSIAEGVSIDETITPIDDSDCFVLQGIANDLVTVFADNRTTAGSQRLELTLLKPDGSSLAVNTSPLGGYDVQVGRLRLTSSGAYTAVVDGVGDATGPYTFGYSNLRNDTPLISEGQSLTRTIDFVGDEDGFTFSGNPGDLVTVFADNRTTAGSQRLELTLLKPDGSSLAVNTSPLGGYDVQVGRLRLTGSGTYTAVVDGVGDATGPYIFGYSNLRNDTPLIIEGQSLTRTIDFVGDEDGFTFSGNPGDLVTVFADNRTTAGSQRLELALLKPDGSSLAVNTSPLGGYDVQVGRLRLTSSGVYTAVVDGVGDATGPYIFGYSNLRNDTSTIVYGQNVVHRIDFVGDEDAFAFSRTAGAVIRVFVDNQTSGGSQRLQLTILKPDGSKLASATSPLGGYDLEVNNLTLPDNGAYIIIVDGVGDATGLYTLSLECLVQCAEMVFWPSKGGNTGNVTLTIAGQSLNLNAQMKLMKTGETEIIPTKVISLPDKAQLMATFDLRNKTPGNWNVVITNPGSGPVTIDDIFQIVNGGGGELAIDLIGPARVRVGREAKFNALIRNEGLVDLEIVLVQITAQLNQSNQAIQPIFIGQSDLPLFWQITMIPMVSPGTLINIPGWITFPSEDCADVESNADNIDDILLNDEKLDEILQKLTKAKRCADIETLLNSAKTRKTQLEDDLKEIRRQKGEIPCPGKPGSKEEKECQELDRLEKEVAGKKTKYEKNTIPKIENALANCKASQGQTAGARQPEPQDSSQNIEASQNGMQAAASLPTCPVTSWDPNDKTGAAGLGEGKYVRPTIAFLPYTVFFENLAAASAPAEEVLIIDQLDSNLDWPTFALDTIQIGEKSMTVPEGTQSFTTTVDLRPAISALVEVELNFNPATGRAEWLFRGKDPTTGELAGFLPPNKPDVAPRGEGWVSYSVRPKQNLPNGTVIKNKATIDFEVGIPPAPMDTPEVRNTIDSQVPNSQVLSLTPTQTTTNFKVQWTGTDTGAGIGGYTIYVSDNNGPYLPWLTNVISTTATFPGLPGHTYRFFSRARDKVGNFEELVLAPEATTSTSSPSYLPIILKN